MEQFPDLSADIPDIPDEFNDKAGLIVPDLTQSMDPIDQYVRALAIPIPKHRQPCLTPLLAFDLIDLATEEPPSEGRFEYTDVN